MGGGVSTAMDVNQTTYNNKVISDLMKSSEARETLFKHIDVFKAPGDDHISLKGKIGLKKILAYFIEPKV